MIVEQLAQPTDQQTDTLILPIQGATLSVARSELANAKTNQEWWMLPGTGFSVDIHMNMLLSDVALSTAEIAVTTDHWLDKTDRELTAFRLEYLSDSLVYPFKLKPKYLPNKGAVSLVPAEYGNENKAYLDTVTESERMGSVKKTVTAIERKLLTEAKPGTAYFFTSPPGWSGFPGIEYLESQTYVYYVNSAGEIEAAGLQTKLDQDGSKKLLEQHGYEFMEGFEEIPKEGQIQEIIGCISAFKASSREEAFLTIVNQIEQITGSNIAGKKSTFAQLRNDISNVNTLMNIDEQIYQTSTDLRRWMNNNIHRLTHDGKAYLDLAQLLGKSVLALSEHHLNKGKQQSRALDDGFILNQGSIMAPLYMMEQFNPMEALQRLQQRPGCNGGGSILVDSASPRLGIETAEKGNSDELYKWVCKKCGHSHDIDVPKGKYKATCDGCGVSGRC